MRRAARTLAFVLILSAILPAAAESAKSLYKKGVNAEARQDYVNAFKFYKAAYDAKPTELKYRVPFERTRLLASASLVHQGQKLREQGKLQDALNLFEQAAAIDPSNDIAAQEIRETQDQMGKQSQGGTPRASRQKTEDPFQQRLEEATGPAELQAPLLSTPISALEMTEDSKVIYETLGKLGGLNVLFDPDYTSRRLTIRLQKVTLSEALDIIALQSRTFWRPVTNNTIFVAQDTQAKRRELEQNVVKTFYLGNVSGPTDLQDIVNAIRTVLEVQRIQQIPSQNAIVVKGTPDQLALAEKMIDDIDKGKPEVVVDVVVAQVRRDKLRNLGILPPQNASVALQSTTGTTTNNNNNGGTSTGATLNFNDLQHLNSTNYAVQIDPVKAVALFNDTDTKILQRPSIRASDNEKAQLKIADKIPIATGSFGTPVGVGAAVGAVGVNTQFTYTDVGVILEITPRVHPDGEVTLKTVMEISNLNGSSNIGGITQPIISTRRVEHTIRLKDGEINMLGGILEVDDTKTRSGTPFLGDIPLLRYNFSQEQIQKTTNEIVFLLEPHIVRKQSLTDINERAYDVGTGGGIDLHVAARPPRAEATEEAAAPAQPAPAASAPASNPVASNPVRPAPVTPAPVTPRPVQPAANPATAEAPRPGGATATNPADTSAKPSPSVPAGGPLTLKLDPGALTQQQGSSFTVNVTLAHAQDVAAVPVQITYDPRVLQFVSISNGDFLAKDGQAVALVHRDDPSSGKLQVTAQRPPGLGGVSGDGTVFSLVFMAKAKGNSAVAISIPGARNSHNQPLEVMGSQTTVSVN
jgi:general secretion pathway protein D